MKNEEKIIIYFRDDHLKNINYINKNAKYAVAFRAKAIGTGQQLRLLIKSLKKLSDLLLTIHGKHAEVKAENKLGVEDIIKKIKSVINKV